MSDKNAPKTDTSGEELARLLKEHKDLLGSIWLYIDWYGVTHQLTTKQKELFADAVDASSYQMAVEDGQQDAWTPVALRWWRDDYDGPIPAKWRR